LLRTLKTNKRDNIHSLSSFFLFSFTFPIKFLLSKNNKLVIFFHNNIYWLSAIFDIHATVVNYLPSKSESAKKSDDNASATELGKELISGLTQLLVLLLLRKGPTHGYELASRLEPVYGRRLSPGTIYPLLQRMVDKEYIQSRTSVVSGRKRRTYLITRLGRIALENALDSLEAALTGKKPDLNEDEAGFELLKSLAQFRILKILDDAPMHGYDLVEQLDKVFGQKIALGTIYPSLHRLADKGLVESHSKWDGDRERKVYDLTPEGKKAVKYALEELASIIDGSIFAD
jgi:DNA-binding PadR family transcriptional regulator